MKPRNPYTHVNDLRTLEQRIIDTLRAHGPLDVVELVSALVVSPRQVQASLHALWGRGEVARGVDWTGHRVYSAA